MLEGQSQPPQGGSQGSKYPDLTLLPSSGLQLGLYVGQTQHEARSTELILLIKSLMVSFLGLGRKWKIPSIGDPVSGEFCFFSVDLLISSSHVYLFQQDYILQAVVKHILSQDSHHRTRALTSFRLPLSHVNPGTSPHHCVSR